MTDPKDVTSQMAAWQAQVQATFESYLQANTKAFEASLKAMETAIEKSTKTVQEAIKKASAG